MMIDRMIENSKKFEKIRKLLDISIFNSQWKGVYW